MSEVRLYYTLFTVNTVMFSDFTPIFFTEILFFNVRFRFNVNTFLWSVFAPLIAVLLWPFQFYILILCQSLDSEITELVFHQSTLSEDETKS